LKTRWGVADRELGINSGTAKRLDQVAPGKGDWLGYTYDFGDDSEHAILVEAITNPEPGTAYPAASPAAAPAHDCGGIWGYDDFIEILTDPQQKEHRERLEWLGLDSAGQFAPAAFDLAWTNKAVSGLSTMLIKDYCADQGLMATTAAAATTATTATTAAAATARSPRLPDRVAARRLPH
jgi:hypothetical protein